jgi:ABC-type lipoprotein export system ATPase subunit
MNSPRGSIWRKWDLHVHTPESALSNNFGDDFEAYAKKFFMAAVNANVAVVGVTDYFGIWGYKQLKRIQMEKLDELFPEGDTASKAIKILLLPNIELRLDLLIDSNRVNFHILFSDEVDCDDIEENFLHEIKVLYEGGPQGADDARKLSKRTLSQIGSDLKQEHPFQGTDLEVGMMNSFVSHVQVSEILARQPGLFENKYLLAVVADEDLSKVSWNGQGHLTRKVLIQKSDFLFASNPKTIRWGLGTLGYDTPTGFIDEFKTIKACLHGSDAHTYEKLFKPDEDKFCWIKADSTFRGLKQAIHEADKRVYIGEKPAVLDRIHLNQSKFIENFSVEWLDDYQGHKGEWFKDINVKLNPELVAIIGNKGSGKSALADILALGGNSYQNRDKYSFLISKKFGATLSRNFKVQLAWFSKEVSEWKNLDEYAAMDQKEGVKYLPQSHFEDICNEVDSSDKFREEIEKVVFQHIPDVDRAGYATFDEIVRAKESVMKAKIDVLKNELAAIVDDLESLDKKSHPSYRNQIKSAIDDKTATLKSHEENPPNEVPKPKDAEDSNPISIAITQRRERLALLDKEIYELETELTQLNRRMIEVDEQIETFSGLIKQFEKTKENSRALLSSWDINVEEILTIEYKSEKLNSYKGTISKRIETIKSQLLVENFEVRSDGKIFYEDDFWIKADLKLNASIGTEREMQKQLIVGLEKQLSESQRKFQDYQEKHKQWLKRKAEIIGSEDQPETLMFYKAKLEYLDKKLSEDIKVRRSSAIQKSIEILEEKTRIKNVYDSIKQAIEKVLESENQLLASYPINIESSLHAKLDLAGKLLDEVNRGKSGSFYGIDKGEEKFNSLLNERDIGTAADLKLFLEDILAHFDHDYRSTPPQDRNIIDQISDLNSFYMKLFSLDYLEAKYDLRHGDKALDALSPGERGALLLVFYLMLDRSDTPLIIDQPEDNLDNQSVAEILVPFIQQAKQRRQIIMVTHNPNLAVVADAEQIIRVDLKKDENNRFEFTSGAIENPKINKEIVDVLEGKMPAFANRSLKYLKSI